MVILQSNDGNIVIVIAKAMGYSRKNANRGHRAYGISMSIKERACGSSRDQSKKEVKFQGC